MNGFRLQECHVLKQIQMRIRYSILESTLFRCRLFRFISCGEALGLLDTSRIHLQIKNWLNVFYWLAGARGILFAVKGCLRPFMALSGYDLGESGRARVFPNLSWDIKAVSIVFLWLYSVSQRAKSSLTWHENTPSSIRRYVWCYQGRLATTLIQKLIKTRPVPIVWLLQSYITLRLKRFKRNTIWTLFLVQEMSD